MSNGNKKSRSGESAMSLGSIKQRVKAISDIVADDEVAHGLEDALYHDFVAYVAKHGPEKYAVMARGVLETGKLKFARWCA